MRNICADRAFYPFNRIVMTYVAHRIFSYCACKEYVVMHGYELCRVEAYYGVVMRCLLECIVIAENCRFYEQIAVNFSACCKVVCIDCTY